jgi:hypothetical protein
MFFLLLDRKNLLVATSCSKLFCALTVRTFVVVDNAATLNAPTQAEDDHTWAFSNPPLSVCPGPPASCF